ncbi:hypothetical protein E2C00_00785 [Streptomyces sp. WAC05374]|uniref:hypothetical protein n=1 Tax=Streptomyces sp. WAC05374 TaxID=2487420 RepID=UPI000F890200|nr:hypothetical protein [Streptomyces sp. WAC05374]RST19572.1 hypothetical protein EF905_00160 [Streptomyces sp. WAC05374]TDF50091.1 hypothetical protein E2B92_00760 [Streptomyces sp. WAC05374]TDF57817.1 hypothetical protein E2C02_08550 [Streptomyces sp. WAC05374]TDF60345.1 hypothetical protein E2C00_00785 [Streptomyces sp. WAC05374]
MERLSAHDRRMVVKAHRLLDAARDAADEPRRDWRRPSCLSSAQDRCLTSIHETELLMAVLHAANHAEEWEIARVRGFRNALFASFLIMSAIVMLFILSGYLDPQALADKLCFDPPPGMDGTSAKVCPMGGGDGAAAVPQGGDVLLVASLRAGAAALTGAVALHGMRGTALPFLVPMGLLLLRVPIGALSALLGVVLIHGDFIPGLTALDRRGQIAAWAIAFGIGQETLTRMLDKRGNALIENVRGPWQDVGPRPLPGRPLPRSGPARRPVGRPDQEPGGPASDSGRGAADRNGGGDPRRGIRPRENVGGESDTA